MMRPKKAPYLPMEIAETCQARQCMRISLPKDLHQESRPSRSRQGGRGAANKLAALPRLALGSTPFMRLLIGNKKQTQELPVVQLLEAYISLTTCTNEYNSMQTRMLCFKRSYSSDLIRLSCALLHPDPGARFC